MANLRRMLYDEHKLKVQHEVTVDTKEDYSGELEVLVKWLQLSDWEHSWNAAASIQEAIFGFQLEDKICQKKKKTRGQDDSFFERGPLVRSSIQHGHVKRQKRAEDYSL
jgi:ribosome-associated translation inhibitor RaiA